VGRGRKRGVVGTGAASPRQGGCSSGVWGSLPQQADASVL